MRICLISWPLGKEPKGIKIASFFLTDLLRILEPISNEVFVISQNFNPSDIQNMSKIHILNTNPALKSEKPGVRILRYIKYQMDVCLKLTQISKSIDIILMYGGSSLLMPNIIGHILRKKVYIFAQGPDFKITKITFPGKIGGILSVILKYIDRLNMRLADRIVVESRSQIEFEGMKGLEYKISIEGARFVETDDLYIREEYNNRKMLVGYIGALTQGKGIVELIKAIPEVHKKDSSIHFLIGGDGPLYNDVQQGVLNLGCKENVEMTGWIPHECLSEYLNSLRLLVLPSYTEGLPTIILEALACGTPILATRVGGIPDILKDGETGFILDNNTSDAIANGIIRALNHPNLNQIAQNGRSLIERNYSFEKAVERYREILSKT